MITADQGSNLTAHEAYERSLIAFDVVVAGIGEKPFWDEPTPCADWNVRTLLNHVVAEDRWVAPLLAGRTIDSVGDELAGDLLGADPVAAWQAARTEAVAAARAAADEQPVALSFGTVPAAEYLWQLAADHLIHGWDLASAAGAASPADADLIDAVARWFGDREEAYRAAGVVGPRTPVAKGASAYSRLLAAFGRSPRIDDVVRDFGAAFNAQDLELVMARVSDDIIFESTAPPDGRRYAGADAVRSCWEELFASSPGATFTEESLMSAADHAVVQWRYDWAGVDPGHVRGVDLIRVRDGLVSEKISYVKG